MRHHSGARLFAPLPSSSSDASKGHPSSDYWLLRGDIFEDYRIEFRLGYLRTRIDERLRDLGAMTRGPANQDSVAPAS